MAREIKFRVWNRDENKMFNHDWLLSAGVLYRALFGTNDNAIVMQFTGFKLDNADIYECDLISLNGKYIYEVRFEDGVFVLYHAKTHALGRWGPLHRIFDRDFSEYRFEVIGNIHQHKHLLE